MHTPNKNVKTYEAKTVRSERKGKQHHKNSENFNTLISEIDISIRQTVSHKLEE